MGLKPKSNTAALAAQEARIKEQEEQLAAEEAEQEKKKKAALNAKRGQSSGRASLLTGLETGIQKRNNLG
tara:strand:+ start:7010 stop:7219 length:210 start_codon:yes stop_codon:yes gene_type:complete